MQEELFTYVEQSDGVTELWAGDGDTARDSSLLAWRGLDLDNSFKTTNNFGKWKLFTET